LKIEKYFVTLRRNPISRSPIKSLRV